jgi:transposase
MAIEDVYMSSKRYTDEFKIEAVKQVLERGHSVRDVAQRLGITTNSLCEWKRKFGQPDSVRRAELDQSAELRRLKAELKRVTEERDILKKAAAYFAKG